MDISTIFCKSTLHYKCIDMDIFFWIYRGYFTEKIFHPISISVFLNYGNIDEYITETVDILNCNLYSNYTITKYGSTVKYVNSTSQYSKVH